MTTAHPPYHPTLRSHDPGFSVWELPPGRRLKLIHGNKMKTKQTQAVSHHVLLSVSVFVSRPSLAHHASVGPPPSPRWGITAPRTHYRYILFLSFQSAVQLRRDSRPRIVFPLASCLANQARAPALTSRLPTGGTTLRKTPTPPNSLKTGRQECWDLKGFALHIRRILLSPDIVLNICTGSWEGGGAASTLTSNIAFFSRLRPIIKATSTGCFGVNGSHR